MLERLDHIRVGTADPAAAALDYTALLGLVASPRRVDPEDSGTGPDVWRVDVGTTGVVFAPSSGTSGTSSTRGTESGMQALVFAGQTDGPSCGFDSGAAVEIIEPSPPCAPLAAAEDGAERLDHAVVLTHDHAAAIALYRDRLGLRLALDRTFDARGVRILFFRIAGITVEVAGPIEPPAPAGPDRFGGLAWRGRDLSAWRARLLGLGFDVSGARAGHKPGTSVCSVRDRTAEVPTLLIAPDPAA